jgi:hypothetical protein
VIISLADAKRHLLVDGSDDDSTNQIYTDEADRYAEDFLNLEIYSDQTAMDAAEDTTGIVATPAIVAACLLILGNLYANREAVVVGKASNELPFGVTSLLWPYRVGLGV